MAIQIGLDLGERRRQKALGELGEQYLGGKTEAFQKLAALDPQRAINLYQIQEAQDKKRQQDLQIASKLAKTILKASPEQRAEVYKASLPLAKKYGIDISGLPDYYSSEVDQQLQNVINIAEGISERKIEPYSTVGKIRADIEAGNISPEIGKRAIEKAISLKPETQITIGAEKEEQKGLGKYRAEQYATIQDESLKAETQNQMLDVMQEAFSDPNVYTGKGAEFISDAKKTAAALGFELKGLTNTQKIESFSNQLALKARGKDMPGAMSEADREFLKNIVPGLKKTREGNLELIRINKKLNQRKIDIARLQEDYLSKYGSLKGFNQAKREFIRNNPLFNKENKSISEIKIDRNDPRVKAALAEGYTMEEISKYMGGI